jgi:hypothetical protein
MLITSLLVGLAMTANGHMYEMLGIAGSSLSAVTKANAGQNISHNHLNPNVLYMMLWLRALLLINLKSIYHVKIKHPNNFGLSALSNQMPC